jgi:hypothetical protein
MSIDLMLNSMIPILMHQIGIATIYVSSVILSSNNMEIQNIVKTVNNRKEKKKQVAMKWNQIGRRIENISAFDLTPDCICKQDSHQHHNLRNM